MAQLLDFQQNERVAQVLSLADLEKGESFLLFATAGGTVKKTALSAFANIRSNGINAINLNDGDELIGVELTDGADDVMLITRGRAGDAVPTRRRCARWAGRRRG